MATSKLSEVSQGHRLVSNRSSWPRMMRAQTAADYVDEKSVETFRRGVGNIYPSPIKVAGKGYRWLREDLDQAIDRLSGRAKAIWDAADVL